MGTALPLTMILSHSAHTFSGAPLSTSIGTSGLADVRSLWMDSCHLLVELNLISNSLGNFSRYRLTSATAWHILMSPLSEASPVHCRFSRLKSSRSISTARSSSGAAGSSELVDSMNSELLHTVATLCSHVKVADSGSNLRQPWKPLSSLSAIMDLYCTLFLGAGMSRSSSSYQQCCTVMRFCVSVPVLSDAMTVVQPSVSTPCRFFTSMDTLCMRLAVKASATVRVHSSPSGTVATMTEMQYTSDCTTVWMPRPRPTPRKVRPSRMATMETHLMKALISRMRGGVDSPPDSAVSPAIWPMTVLSPVPTTTPVP
mmetsp:Transcript_18105/g.45587  ORF Transcript_18105/g.45587 Transcript_18105/m.45587 type:complete len:314 (+) Transcript_18105:2934-3875(+)